MNNEKDYTESNMAKKYIPTEVEPRIYKMWENGGYFTAKIDPKKKPYTIVLPPPNSNGKLHVGHALMLAIEDLLIRWKRMQGYSALWLPGTDHAGFETQVVYEKELEKEGKSRMDFDRDTLYKRIFKFVKEQGAVILDQTKALGPSLDWSRYTFTLDQQVVDTVYTTFEKMAKEGLVYRNDYIVNYCTRHNTTLSDLELDYKEQTSKLYYIRYHLVEKADNEPEYVVVATTRPEPIFADTHLAVNPKDKKNNWLVGRRLLNPLTSAEMVVIQDPFVDPKFGTGIVKLTPAHDKTDFEVAAKHGLPIIPAFGTDGKINERGGELTGLYIKKARQRAEEILKEKGLIEKIDENYQNNIAVCYKCGTVIEPIVLPNWFVKVESLKKAAHNVVKKGQVKIYPKWQEIKYHRWMEEMRDWPISRQIIWGIQLPVWYDIKATPNLQATFIASDGQRVTGKVDELLASHKIEEIEKGLQTLIAPKDAKYIISKEKPAKGEYLRETDTFDTWYSSGHWPLVTLKYPQSEDFKYFYPTAVLETGWEILRFWVSRMIMFGIYLTGKPPFSEIYLHGLVRAEDGKKMSKSLGNQVDPIDMVKEYGADALRLGLISGTYNGKDFAFPKDKVIAYRNFSNKLWNMARFIDITVTKSIDECDCGCENCQSKIKPLEEVKQNLNDEDRALLSDLNKLIKETNSNLEKYRFADAAESLYHFVWERLASQYIESVKTRSDQGTALSVLIHTFKTSLKLLHPFMPFVTEEIWSNMKNENEAALIVTDWPK